MLKKGALLLPALPLPALQGKTREAVISRGNRPAAGNEVFRGGPGFSYCFNYSGWGVQPGIFLNDYWGKTGGADDLGPSGDFARLAAALAGRGSRVKTAVRKCGAAEDLAAAGIDICLIAVNRLEPSYPGAAFIR